MQYIKEAMSLVSDCKVKLVFEVQQDITSYNRSMDKCFLVVDMDW